MIDALVQLSYNEDSKIVLRCRCCNAPFAYLVLTPNGYALLIESRHHGEPHQNLFWLPLPQVAPTPQIERSAPDE